MASGSSPATLTAAAFLALLLSSAARAAEASSAAPAAALDQVCGRLGSYYVTPALCASALCADATAPCRAARDAPAVAALAARLAADNATAARDSIEAALLNSSSSSSSPPAGPAANNSSAAASASAAAAAAAAARSSCLQLYAGAVPALRLAARAVAAGRYRGAREVLQAAQYVASGCEGMAGDAAAAALPRENGGFGDMAFVAHAVVASMAAD
ncbi:unnamed protein product [Urochloa decumbens]|uniref:Pectinesterase inhibitor domain-containing protein n=1 Tax=Urochloa decumbens TaxID=240449 RepID=A0ABC8VXD6_9POAL